MKTRSPGAVLWCMERKIPLYRATVVDDDHGVEFVSLVKSPAIEVNWVAFAGGRVAFEAVPDQMKLAGPLLIPDLPIYRVDENMGEFYIVFDRETIELTAQRFNRRLNGSNINIEHTDRTVEGFVSENWITSAQDKSREYGFDLPQGTWFGVIKVEDEDFWAAHVRGGAVMGFSIEGLFGLDKIKNRQDMSKTKTKLAEAKLQDGTVVVTDTDVMAVGDEIFVVDAEGNRTPAPDGDHVLEDGTVVSVSQGKISGVESPDVEEQEDAPAAPEIPAEEIMARIAMLEERIAALEELAKAASQDAAAAMKSSEELSGKVAELSKIPGAPAKTTRAHMSDEKGADRFDDAVSRVRYIAKKLS